MSTAAKKIPAMFSRVKTTRQTTLVELAMSSTSASSSAIGDVPADASKALTATAVDGDSATGGDTENVTVEKSKMSVAVAVLDAKPLNASGSTNGGLITVPVLGTPEGSYSHLMSLLEERSWKKALSLEFRKPYMHEIVTFLEKQKNQGVKVFPPRELLFNAFNLTPLNRIRVVLIGQDPYHDDRQAHGLCFSVCKGVRPPPSLNNIFKELKEDIPLFQAPNHGCLESWARQGVFMLNAALTVEAHRANSHSGIGWHRFTDEVIRIVSRECKGVVFLLWGGFAHKKEVLVDRKKHSIVKTAHPSPLSARLFLGSRCFSKTNAALSKFGRPPIDWTAF